MEIDRPLTVSALTEALKDHVGLAFGRIQVEGEVSQFTAHRSGHWYFGIRDQGAVLNCVMFRGDNNRVGWMPAPGDQVVLSGGIDIYAPQGRYNLIARRMVRSGEGERRAQLEALKRKLLAEGLLDPARRRALPQLPSTIGVATSPTGAAIRDIQEVLQRRFAGLHLIFAPCRVQGEGSAEEIRAALGRIVRDGRAEVIIVGRGGGSPEDLAAFNDEALARDIAASPIPIVSAVGHEIDVSISDLVADARAATPSHAAELVVPERDALSALVDELGDRLITQIQQGIRRRQERLDAVSLTHPQRRIDEARLRLDEVMDRLMIGGRHGLERRRSAVAQVAGRLDALSPLAVLDRGYAVVSKGGQIARSATELSPGDRVDLRLTDGSVAAEIA